MLGLIKLRQTSGRRLLFYAALFCGLALLVWPARTLRSDNFVFYFSNSRRLVPFEEIGNTKYLPLLQVLNAIGKVSGLQEKRNTLKVGIGNSHLELHADDERIRINKKSSLLSAPVRVSEGKWMVPADFLTTAVPELTSLGVEYQAGTNRIFLGDVKPGSFTLRLASVNSGARLTFQFTDKVTVRTASVNGKWVMFLGDHPIEPLEQSFHFQNPYVSDVQFSDDDGLPKLIITPSAGGLNFYPVLAEGGKILLADILKPPAPVANAQATPPQAQPAPSAPKTPPPSPTAAPGTPGPPVPAGPALPVIVLDAGHGGDDAGARSRDGITEKDLATQLVARVQQALLSTGKYRVVLTRNGDANVSFEQRTLTANTAGAAYFLTFHAGNLAGSSPRVAVYTYQAPNPPAPAAGDEAKPLFISWDRVQEVHLEESRQLAQALQQKFVQINGVTADAPSAVPERTLRSVNAPAVAIEVGSLTSENDAGSLTNPAFQDQLSAAVAAVLATLQPGGA